MSVEAMMRIDHEATARRRHRMKQHFHRLDRVEVDNMEWMDKKDDELGDILKEDRGGRYVLIPDINGTIIKGEDG